MENQVSYVCKTFLRSTYTLFTTSGRDMLPTWFCNSGKQHSITCNMSILLKIDRQSRVYPPRKHPDERPALVKKLAFTHRCLWVFPSIAATSPANEPTGEQEASVTVPAPIASPTRMTTNLHLCMMHQKGHTSRRWAFTIEKKRGKTVNYQGTQDQEFVSLLTGNLPILFTCPYTRPVLFSASLLRFIYFLGLPMAIGGIFFVSAVKLTKLTLARKGGEKKSRLKKELQTLELS